MASLFFCQNANGRVLIRAIHKSATIRDSDRGDNHASDAEDVLRLFGWGEGGID